MAKRIIVFTSDPEKTESHLTQLKEWLLACNYPKNIIEKGIKNAKLQGPAPDPTKKKKGLPLVTTFYSNIVRQANLLLADSCTNNRIKEVF